MRVHLLHRYVLDTVVIMEEVNLPHPKCPRCDILFHRWALNESHSATDQCSRGVERKRWRLAEAELRESSEKAFEAYREPLENVTTFKYLVQVLAVGDDDWITVVGNLSKERKSWGRLS